MYASYLPTITYYCHCHCYYATTYRRCCDGTKYKDYLLHLSLLSTIYKYHLFTGSILIPEKQKKQISFQH